MATVHAYPKYDIAQTYRWNYDHAPSPIEVDLPAVAGDWTFCGLRVDSPLGMPAGPLLNGRWVLYYAGLGFDVLTYKTVRSRPRECYALPNLQPVTVEQLAGNQTEVPIASTMQGSWAVSFGMPSMSPDDWRADVEATRNSLPGGKLLSVSVVGSVLPEWTLDDLADDYAQCARWAVDSGADCIEANFSCPNVSTCDGQLFQQPAAAKLVSARIREAIGSDVPFLIKIGHISDTAQATELVAAVEDSIDAFAMTNSVAATVRSEDALLFDGERRGICGAATLATSIAQTKLFADVIAQRNSQVKLVGVGGAATAPDVTAYLNAGAEAVHIATAAMVDPLVAIEIRKNL